MSKSNFYLSQCEDAAARSQMCFNLGAVLVKGGKVISQGWNHHRTHYDGSEVTRSGKGHRKPVSMHAEMHAIYAATGMSPAFKKQVAAKNKLSPPSSSGFDPPMELPQRLSAGLRPRSHIHNIDSPIRTTFANAASTRELSESDDQSEDEEQQQQSFRSSGRKRDFERERWRVQRDSPSNRQYSRQQQQQQSWFKVEACEFQAFSQEDDQDSSSSELSISRARPHP
jgi:hypothetical protein